MESQMSSFSFSNFDISAIVKELDVILQKSVISNIYEVEELLILKIKTKNGGKKNLIIERDSRINTTEYDYPIPQYPSQFILSLRKFLRKKWISRVYQYNFDRIVIFEIYNPDTSPWKFVIELFNKGNYLLIDHENRLIIAKKYLKFRERDILPKQIYQFPSSRGINFLKIRKFEFKDILMESDAELVRTIARKINISGVYAEEICFKAGLDKKSISNQLSEAQIENLFNSLKKLRNQLLFEPINAKIILDDENNYDILLPINLEMFSDEKKINFEAFNDAVDEFFSVIDSKRLKRKEGGAIKKKMEAQKKILATQKAYIEELEEKKKRNYEIGDFIYNNFNTFERLLNVIRDALKKGYSFEQINQKLSNAKKEGLSDSEFFKKILAASKKVIVEFENKEIALDLNESTGENANFFYNKGKKAKRKKIGTIQAISETEKKIKKLKEQEEVKEESYISLIKKPKKKWYEKFRWFYSSDNFLVIGGRDAVSNEDIFNKYLDPHELIFHTDIAGSPLTVIKNPTNLEIPENTIQESAEFVASYSRAWKENWGYADVFYVNAEQVSRTPPSGEFLPRGSFMITGKKNFIKNAKTVLAISVNMVEVNKTAEGESIFYPKVVSGPLNAIKNQEENYLIIKPSRVGLTKGKLAEKIKNALKYKIDEEMKKWLNLLSIDNIILYLPSGFSEIERDS